MKNADVELIQRVLDGDDTAFSELVNKYRKSVHALAWRKIQDFHIAEDITQETFLKAYQGLSTLKEPQSFASWLYVIATNHCKTWLSKKRLQTQSLENTDTDELETATYSSYISTEKERDAVETKREVVKKLLAKLQESDRTVITLYYLGGMTYEEISRFLGVSISAIKNRLYRARQHLKKEEPMIKEALENYQIAPHLTENIMQEIGRLKPAAPIGGKPLMPWMIAASSMVVILLLLGLGSQHLLFFQQTYSIDAQAETTVELVDALIVLNLDTITDDQNQFGSHNVLGKTDGNGQKPNEILLASADAEGEDVSVPKQQWIQSEPIIGSVVENLFATNEGELYTVLDAHIYKWQDDKTGWQQLSGDIRDYHERLNETTLITDVPIAKWDNTLYMALKNLLLASKDEGKTWDIIHSWPPDYFAPKELVFTEQAIWAIYSKGAFRSEDNGKTWEDVDDDELFRGYIFFKAIQNTVFAGTYTGLYRWNTGSWERIELPVPEAMIIGEVATTKDRLYIMASLGFEFYDEKAVMEGRQRTWWIFRTDDLGNTWKDITPTNAWPLKGRPPDIQLVAAGDTIMLMGQGMVRSTDGGDTWLPLQAPHTLPGDIKSYRPSVALDESLFYAVWNGLHRTNDGGKSWNMVNINPNTRRFAIQNILPYKRNEKTKSMQPTLYGLVGNKIVETSDKGKSWKTVKVEVPKVITKREDPLIMQITSSDGVVYAKSTSNYPIGELRYFRVSEDGEKLEPIQGIPTFDSRELKEYLRKSQNLSLEELQKRFSGATQFFKWLVQTDPVQLPQHVKDGLIQSGLHGPFAVSGDTFYMEYNLKLFRWEPGDTEWQDIGQEDTYPRKSENFQLAVSGDTVYVGRRNGHLVVSFNKGNNWTDLTPGLPFQVKSFNDIVVSGTTACVATNEGTLISDDGKNWRVITDTDGTNLIMEELAADDTKFFGITQDTGIYRLESDSNTWQQIITEIPESAKENITSNRISLAVDRNTLYLGTRSDGMFHFNLAE